MSGRRDFCKACSNIKHGIKTRRAVAHTCAMTDNAMLAKVDALRKRAETMTEEELVDVNNRIGEAIKLTEEFLKKYGIKQTSETGDGIGKEDHKRS